MSRYSTAAVLPLLLLVACVHANSHLPPILQSKIASEDVTTTPVDYGGNHPYERRRRLDELDPDVIPMEMNRDAYEPLRIRYITAPIEASPDYSSSSGLEEILGIVAETWSKHLSVYPVSEPIPISRQDCFGFLGRYIPDSLLESGVDDADMVIYVGAETEVEGEQLCDLGTLAFAFACAVDQVDRPVIGVINFCLENIAEKRRLEEEETRKLSFAIEESDTVLPAVNVIDGNDPRADVAHIAVHEIAHVLGFAFNLFKYFWDPETGLPRTARPFQESQVTCVDGSVQTLLWPADNTVQTGQTTDGRIYHQIVTPRVAQVARNHFDCQSLTGARLENQPTSTEFSCTGSHWDERQWLSELLGPIFSGYTDTLSPLTLALFEDSGWYQVRYDNAKLTPYGKGRGCDFVNERCIINDAVPDFGRDTFCANQNTFQDGAVATTEIVCDPTHKSFTACDLFDINDIPSQIVPLLPQDRVHYFSNPDLLSVFNRADFCPLPIIDARLDCTNTLDNPQAQTYQGESRGLNSRCINGQVGNVVVPGCFAIECDAAQHKVIIDGKTCDFDGQILDVLTVNFRQAKIECPILTSICPELFCPGECSGRGVCDYSVVPPRCNCFDTDDTTAACNANMGGSSPPPPTPFTFTFPPPTSGGPAPTSGFDFPTSQPPTTQTPQPPTIVPVLTLPPTSSAATLPMTAFGTALMVVLSFL